MTGSGRSPEPPTGWCATERCCPFSFRRSVKHDSRSAREGTSSMVRFCRHRHVVKCPTGACSNYHGYILRMAKQRTKSRSATAFPLMASGSSLGPGLHARSTCTEAERLQEPPPPRTESWKTGFASILLAGRSVRAV